VFPDSVDIQFLVKALRCDHLLFGGDIDGIEKDVLKVDAPIVRDHSDGIINIAWVEGIAFLEEGVKIVQDPFRKINVDIVTLDHQGVAFGVDLSSGRPGDTS